MAEGCGTVDGGVGGVWREGDGKTRSENGSTKVLLVWLNEMERFIHEIQHHKKKFICLL